MNGSSSAAPRAPRDGGVRALDVRSPRPLCTDHQLQPPLRVAAQIEMILQQRPDQLATARFKTRFQLRVLKPVRLLARQPTGQRPEPLGRARELFDPARSLARPRGGVTPERTPLRQRHRHRLTHRLHRRLSVVEPAVGPVVVMPFLSADSSLLAASKCLLGGRAAAALA